MSVETSNVKSQGQQDRNRAAAGYMLVAVLGSSLLPLAISIGGGSEAPFLFSASIRLGLLVGSLIFLMVIYKSLFFRWATWVIVLQNIVSLPILLFIIAHFDFTFFALSTRYIDVSVTTILFESWPIFMIFVVGLLFRGERRYQKITIWTISLLAMGFLGFAFAVLSESGEFNWFHDTTSGLRLLWGIVAALIAVAVTTLAAFGFRWGADIGKELARDIAIDKDVRSLDLFAVVVANLIGNSFAIIVGLIGGRLLINETMTTNAFLVAFVVGAFAVSASSIAWRKANLLTSNLGINALSYLMPILSLLFLWMFSQIHVIRPDFLVIGAAAIITANLLINFEAEVRLGFKSLIIALWVCGMIVYLRPIGVTLFVIDNWLWTGTSYFQALALAATVFTLILSFRVARLVSRTSDEEGKTFALFQKLDMLARRGVINPEVRQYLLTIDVSEQKPKELKRAYNTVMSCISEALEDDTSVEDKQQLSEATAELNALVHSKQQGLVIGELFALCIFGGIGVFIALSARPDVSDWTAFLVEMFALLFSAVVIFLIFNVQDLQRARIAAILKQTKQGEYGLVFRDIQARAFERWLSVIIIVVLIVGYAWLLWEKWLGQGFA